MAKPKDKTSDPTLAELLPLGWLAIAVGVVPLAGWLHLQRYFCPPGTLLAGFIETVLGHGSAFVITVVVCVVNFFGLYTWRKAKAAGVTSPMRYSERTFRMICIVAAVLALLPWLNILLSYACFSASRLYLHSSPFEGETTYIWSDVRYATPFCEERSSKAIVEPTLKLELAMKDGRTVIIGFPESRIEPHYAELKAALITLPRNRNWPEWARAARCPKEYKDLFARP